MAFYRVLHLTNKQRKEVSVKRTLTSGNGIELIEDCRVRKDSAREELYVPYSRQMLVVCYRYTGDMDTVYDILHSGSTKIFTRFTLHGECALSIWVTKVMVIQAIDYLRKQHRFGQLVINEEQLLNMPDEANITENGSRLTGKQLMVFVVKLLDGCRIMFNLYVFEGRSHREIAELFHIREHSSTS